MFRPRIIWRRALNNLDNLAFITRNLFRNLVVLRYFFCWLSEWIIRSILLRWNRLNAIKFNIKITTYHVPVATRRKAALSVAGACLQLLIKHFYKRTSLRITYYTFTWSNILVWWWYSLVIFARSYSLVYALNFRSILFTL